MEGPLVLFELIAALSGWGGGMWETVRLWVLGKQWQVYDWRPSASLHPMFLGTQHSLLNISCCCSSAETYCLHCLLEHFLSSAEVRCALFLPRVWRLASPWISEAPIQARNAAHRQLRDSFREQLFKECMRNQMSLALLRWVWSTDISWELIKHVKSQAPSQTWGIRLCKGPDMNIWKASV